MSGALSSAVPPRTKVPESARSAPAGQGEALEREHLGLGPGGLSAVQVAALFTCRSGPYGALGCEVFDLARDARSFDLSSPVVAHPPCRAWGRLRQFAKPRADERDLAVWAIWVARHCGGIVEHPAASKLWQFMGIRPGVRDEFGGLLYVVHQDAFGHRAPKPTGFYCVRCESPRAPALYEAGQGRVERMGRQERERTPLPLAETLVELARAAA